MRSTWHGPSKQRRAVPGRLWHLKSECRLVTDDVLSRVSSQGFTLRLTIERAGKLQRPSCSIFDVLSGSIFSVRRAKVCATINAIVHG